MIRPDRREPAIAKASGRRLGMRRLLVVFGVLLFISAEPLPEAIPIERVQLPPERLAAEMDRVRRNILVRMPRDQFEELVKQASRAEAAGKNSPRLQEARYRATL